MDYVKEPQLTAPTSPNLVNITGGKADEQAIADDLKARYARIMGSAATLMDEARRHGMRIEFAGIQMDAFGKFFVSPVGIVKAL